MGYGISGCEDWEHEAEEPYYYGFDREEDNTRYEYYLAYHQRNAFQGWLANHSEARESFKQFKVSAMIHHNPIRFFCKLTHLLVWEKDHHLWEGAFGANRYGLARAEEAVEPEIATMTIANSELAAEPGMGSVRQNKRHCE
jgi:hypothetical protein